MEHKCKDIPYSVHTLTEERLIVTSLCSHFPEIDKIESITFLIKYCPFCSEKLEGGKS